MQKSSYRGSQIHLNKFDHFSSRTPPVQNGTLITHSVYNIFSIVASAISYIFTYIQLNVEHTFFKLTNKVS
jgi:hypothetical protein